MARMIPPYVRPGTPNGESRVFRLLETATELAGYTILHSLNIASHSSKREGETDFVVLGPRGIIILEVKGATRISRNKGMWRYSNSTMKYETLESPFNQARTNYYSLIDAVQSSIGVNLKSLGGYGVVFPNCVFCENSAEWNESMFLDENRLDQLGSFVLSLFDYWHSRSDSVPTTLDESTINSIREYMRGDFETLESPLTIAKETTKLINHLTSEQYQYLDGAAENPRLLIRGYAGTGKTLLAIEQAKRRARQGERVLFLCFNRLLSVSLRLQLWKWSERVKVRTFDSLLYELAERALGGLPRITVNELRPIVESRKEQLHGTCESFSYLIIDEAQDIVSDFFLWVIDEHLVNGAAKGNWSIFYDDEVQSNLYSDRDGAHVFNKLGEFASKFQLNTNCRNPRRLIEDTKRITSLPIPPYLRVELPQDPLECRFYSSGDELANQMTAILDALLREGFPTPSITILFPSSSDEIIDRVYSRISSRVNSLIDLSSYYPAEIESLRFDLQPGNIGYCTVRSFKGLENDVILACGVESIQSDYERSIVYTALTRARVRTYLLAHQRVQDKIMKAVGCKTT